MSHHIVIPLISRKFCSGCILSIKVKALGKECLEVCPPSTSILFSRYTSPALVTNFNFKPKKRSAKWFLKFPQTGQICFKFLQKARNDLTDKTIKIFEDHFVLRRNITRRIPWITELAKRCSDYLRHSVKLLKLGHLNSYRKCSEIEVVDILFNTFSRKLTDFLFSLFSVV